MHCRADSGRRGIYSVNDPEALGLNTKVSSRVGEWPRKYFFPTLCHHVFTIDIPGADAYILFRAEFEFVCVCGLFSASTTLTG